MLQLSQYFEKKKEYGTKINSGETTFGTHNYFKTLRCFENSVRDNDRGYFTKKKPDTQLF